MKFLLAALNAKYIHSNPAIYSLRAYAGKELQQHIELAEYTINQFMEDILADIYHRKPDVIGFSCYIWNWRLITELIRELPKILPDTDIWLGGPEVTYNAPEILKSYPQVNGIIIGEGEETFRELLTWYVKNGTSPLASIAGLCLPMGYTPARKLLDISTLPFLYDNLEPFANKIIYYESSRGCPYRCSYCLSSIDKRVRLRDICVVKKELQFFLDNCVKQVKFVDRTFNCNHEHAITIWKYIHEHDNGVTNFHFEISADILQEDEIMLLNSMRPGLVQLEIGVQSTNPETIRAIHRVMNVNRLEQVVGAIHKGNNIHQHLDLIAGLPYEDYESFGQSFNRVYNMHPQQLQLGFLKVLKGSDMQEKTEEFGIRYLEIPPYEVLSTNWLSYADILKLKTVEEMVELYYNSSQFTHTLPFLEQAFPSPFAMYEALAAYYKEKDYFVNSPARAYRYHVLLEFVERYDSVYSPVYRQLLTYDMYLRENLKSRPDFAMDLSEDSVKSFVRDFYKKEEEQRRFLPDYAEYDWKQLSKMTHLEPFTYPVWDITAVCQLRKEYGDKEEQQVFIPVRETKDIDYDYIEECERKLYVLFDYRNRNPLNQEARNLVIIE